jgi:hypothetical protein
MLMKVRTCTTAPAKGDVTTIWHKDLRLTKKMSSHLAHLTSTSPRKQKVEAKALLSKKQKKTERWNPPAQQKRSKGGGGTSSWERGVYTTTAPLGNNHHLKRTLQSAHPVM